jgi:hypothetical protein
LHRNGLQVGIWILIFGLIFGSASELLAGESGTGGIFAGLALGIALLVCRLNPQKSLRP